MRVMQVLECEAIADADSLLLSDDDVDAMFEKVSAADSRPVASASDPGLTRTSQLQAPRTLASRLAEGAMVSGSCTRRFETRILPHAGREHLLQAPCRLCY